MTTFKDLIDQRRNDILASQGQTDADAAQRFRLVLSHIHPAIHSYISWKSIKTHENHGVSFTITYQDVTITYRWLFHWNLGVEHVANDSVVQFPDLNWHITEHFAKRINAE